MCDYSLGGIRNRLAVEGEELTVHRFRTRSIGLASPEDLRAVPCAETQSLLQRLGSFLAPPTEVRDATAVCIPCGARLRLSCIPGELQRAWGVSEEEEVQFLQTSANANTYRDAVQFRTGRRALLQEASEGIRVKVLSLSGSEDSNLPREVGENELPVAHR